MADEIAGEIVNQGYITALMRLGYKDAPLAQMNERPRMPIIFQQRDTHKERRFGLRPPEPLRGLVERMKGVDWLVKHCTLAFDDNSPAATRDMAIQSNGQIWTNEKESEGERFVTQGCTSIDRDTGRIGITIYRPGFGESRILAEEVYHVVFGILRETNAGAYKTTERWYRHGLRNGADATVSLDEVFSKPMGLEDSGVATGLPPGIVKHARNIFSAPSKVPDSVMEKVKAG